MISVSDLQAVAIFRELSPEDLARLAPSLTERTFAPGATIIYRGDPGYSLFAILEGSVSITLRNDNMAEGFRNVDRLERATSSYTHEGGPWFWIASR